MSRAFSLLELIFVVVLIGIMAGLGASALRQDYLLHDSHYIASKIMQTQYEAIGYDHRRFDGTWIDDTSGCVIFDKATLEEGGYGLHVSIDYSDIGADRICFDHAGRPKGGAHGSPLLTERKLLKLSYRDKEAIIAVESATGYVIINP